MPGMLTPLQWGSVFFAVVWLTGCATPQVTALLRQHPATALLDRVELVEVPFYPQELYQCGPAALATTLVYSGVATSPDALVPQVYLPGREGSLQTEMLAAARRHERVAYPLAPQITDVLREVAAGTPVIVLQNLSVSFAPLWHYAAVVGYDLPRGEIILRSGTTRRLTMALTTFEHTWARSEYWAMVTPPSGKIPVTATEENYLIAVAALERTAPIAAQRAYAASLERWPHNLVALVGYGNVAYAQNDIAEAAEYYQAATRYHPGSADAWNNLAQAQMELGRREEALAAAQRAVSLGGARISQYQETLRAVLDTH